MLVAQLGPMLMFIAGITLLTAILLRRTYRQLSRGRKKYDSRPIDAQPRPTGAWDGAKADSSAVIERQKVQLAELSRDVNGQLDTKIMVLRELVSQSKHQIDRMEELLADLECKESHLTVDARN